MPLCGVVIPVREFPKVRLHKQGFAAFMMEFTSHACVCFTVARIKRMLYAQQRRRCSRSSDSHFQSEFPVNAASLDDPVHCLLSSVALGMACQNARLSDSQLATVTLLAQASAEPPLPPHIQVG